VPKSLALTITCSPNLQHKIKIDPPSYRDDFLAQYHQYQQKLIIFLQSPNTSDENSLISLQEHVDFISHVADCYPDATENFPQDLINLLKAHHATIQPDLRDKLVGSLVLLRNKDLIDSTTLFNTLFPLLITTGSKSLRVLLAQKILSDVRSSNTKAANHKLNRSVQTVLYNLITSDRSSSKALWAVKITRELWKRQIWTNAKAVEIMKEAALADNEKVITGGVRFFLGGDKEREEAEDSSSDEDEGIDMGRLRHQMGINKKSKKRDRELKRAAATVKRKERKKNAPHPLNFSALHLLHDPQGFTEQLFAKHLQPAKAKLTLEHRLLVLQLVTRLVGLHKLTLVALYSFFLKFLTPRQRSVTTFLACLAQATHNLVPPDLLEPCVLKIANEFVSEASAGEVAAAGLNAIREVCVRQPLAMSDTLLQDLVMYRKSKDKGVMMAAKGLLSLYREVGAALLKRRDRGKEASMGIRSGEVKERRFGEVEEGRIEGIELLEAWKEEQRKKDGVVDGEDDALLLKREEEEGWKNWDVEDNGSDDSGGWIDVESDGPDIEVSDSEDEKRPSKKAKVNESTNGLVTPASEQVAGKPMPQKGDEENKPSTFATTRILTPADLAKLRELQQSSSVQKNLQGKGHHKPKQSLAARHAEDGITAEDIELPGTLGRKTTKEEKIALAKADREDKHQSSAAKRKEKKQENGKSSTNKEKARQKNFFMTLGKAKKKGKRSLGEVRKTLMGHVERQKRGGRRGNR